MRPNDVDFDVAFQVDKDAQVSTSGDPVPSVWHVSGAQSPHDIRIDGEGWTALTGYTGQYAYRGAVMHPSEFMGGRLEQDVLAQPGVYALTVVYDPDPAPEEDDIVGWVVLRKDDPVEGG